MVAPPSEPAARFDRQAPGTAAGNALITIPVLLILLAAMALVLANSRPAGPDSRSRPAAPAD
jgi:hypothetical protein